MLTPARREAYMAGFRAQVRSEMLGTAIARCPYGLNSARERWWNFGRDRARMDFDRQPHMAEAIRTILTHS